MNKFRREVTIEILVGLFMFTVLIALGVFTIVLSRENLLQKTYEYEIVFPEISGLRPGDNVFLRGMNVGRVIDTYLEEGNVRVYISLDEPLALRQGYKVEIINASMLGGKFLKIYEGDLNASRIGPTVTVLGSPPIDMIEEMNTTVSGLKAIIASVSEGKGMLGKLMNDEALYQNTLEISESLKEIVARLQKGEGTLGRLLASDDTLYNDAAATVASLRKVAEQLEQGEGTMGRLLQDETVYEDASVLLVNLREMSDCLVDQKGTLGKLIAADDAVYDDLKASLASIRRISESIDAGQGTMGRLVRDPALYDELTLFVEDARAAVDDLREASPITSFGSVFFGAF
ncbi:MlaD family protein [Pontiella sulfatireligans]|uniref:Mce/MlaD domain-containing protein n=1 Tax=Pontiella sulfatireligans TaxID=2750658 RepID=A0A6C2URF7_9BACT|nr:MlaD family protein [Pontiella sulfatireligans]VGO22838.1 hypothetical protein SCARR_04935 [Pontiella sulfatireligans]